jgi:hypothetical protein
MLKLLKKLLLTILSLLENFFVFWGIVLAAYLIFIFTNPEKYDEDVHDCYRKAKTRRQMKICKLYEQSKSNGVGQ